MSEKVKKRLVAIVGVIFVITFIYQVLQCKDNNPGYLVQEIPNEGVVGIIGDQLSASQTFVAEEDFYGVYILMADYGLPKFGWADFEIKNTETGEIVYEEVLWYHTLKNDSFRCFASGDKIKVDEPTEFEMTIQSRFSLYQGITVWCSEEDVYLDGEMFFEGQEQEGDWCFGLIEEKYEERYELGMLLKRTMLIGLLLCFVIAHILVDIRTLYDFIYRKRVWIAIILFIFCVLNKFHFSSVAMYDGYIESGQGTEYISPVFGEQRPIRSDEWLVTLPRLLSAEYSDYGKYNDVVRATETTNLSASGLYLDYSALAKPADWGFYLFGSEYGLSYMWCFKMIFGYLFVFELCMLLTKQNRLISLLGATIIWWSAYNMWWSIAPWILTGSAAIVFFNYFMQEDTRWKKLLYGIGIAIFGANFCVDLYPAWQVPAGYVYLMLLLWVFIKSKDKWKNFKLVDWGIGFGCIGFMASVIVVYFINYSEYMTAIMNTAYPGSRVDYGSYYLHKLLGFLSSTLSPLIEFGNASENACFYGAFPLGIILAIIVLWRQKGKNLLIWLLMIPTTLLLCYCSFPLPEVIAKYTLMTFSTSFRAADILGFVCALLMVIALADLYENGKLKWYAGIPISLLCIGLALQRELSLGREGKYLVAVLIFALVSVVLFVLLITDVKEKWNKVGVVLITIGILYSGLRVHPLMAGLDAIYSRPIASVISEIVEEDPDGKWIATDSMFTQNYLIALGAPTYNSVNYIPNMEFWHILDPNGIYDFVYNRYAHVIVSLGWDETSMGLIQQDLIQLNLADNAIPSLDVSYILSVKPLEDNEEFDVTELYCNHGLYIYKCNY